MPRSAYDPQLGSYGDDDSDEYERHPA
ncbi:hypothetical protein F66182_10924, partial [Fusarium sp. NRRL 66182]